MTSSTMEVSVPEDVQRMITLSVISSIKGDDQLIKGQWYITQGTRKLSYL